MKPLILLATVGAIILSAGALAGGSVLRHDPDMAPLTRTELAPFAGTHAYDAVRTQRPQWLAPDPAHGRTPAVYIEMACVPVTCLRWVESDQVEAIHFVGGTDAPRAWLGSEEGAALVVRLRMRSVDSPPDADRR